MLWMPYVIMRCFPIFMECGGGDGCCKVECAEGHVITVCY